LIVLGIDTATRASAVALRLDGGEAFELRDDPADGVRPGHATRLLAMADALLRERGVDWGALGRIAVGIGPGGFTGLRVGLATARGLAHALSCELAGVSSLEALAAAALARASESPEGVLAVIDARRGEVFAAAFARAASEARPIGLLAGPRALAPERVAELLEGAGTGRWLAVGDGALRYAQALACEQIEVAGAQSPLHLVRAEVICELGAAAVSLAQREPLLPQYLRRPDAELAFRGAPAAGASRA
jgi:tRNA threonylcarbamoyladenosine biosynthesis protein TsaB